jgi:hypothetical protein
MYTDTPKLDQLCYLANFGPDSACSPIMQLYAPGRAPVLIMCMIMQFENPKLTRPVVIVAICKNLLVMFETEVSILHIAYISDCRHFDNGMNLFALHIAYISDCCHLDNGKNIITLHIAYISDCRHLDNGRNVLTLHIAYISNCRHHDNGRNVLPDAYFAGYKHLFIMFDTEVIYFAIYHPFLVILVADASNPFRNCFEPIMVHSSIA